MWETLLLDFLSCFLDLCEVDQEGYSNRSYYQYGSYNPCYWEWL